MLDTITHTQLQDGVTFLATIRPRTKGLESLYFSRLRHPGPWEILSLNLVSWRMMTFWVKLLPSWVQPQKLLTPSSKAPYSKKQIILPQPHIDTWLRQLSQLKLPLPSLILSTGELKSSYTSFKAPKSSFLSIVPNPTLASGDPEK